MDSATLVTRQRRQYMLAIHRTGWGLSLESLSTVGAEVQVGVRPAQQQAGQDTPQRLVLKVLQGRKLLVSKKCFAMSLFNLLS